MADQKENKSSQVAAQGQRLLIVDRKVIEISGVDDVVGFDETGAVLRTTLGMLAIEGEDLHVVKLDPAGGLFVIEGKIGGVYYGEAGGPKGKNKRLFR